MQMFSSSKKLLAAFSFLILTFQAVITPTYADAPRHALSLFGDPKYEPGFAHFDYVNPSAPKGGEVREAAYGSFDSFNPYILKGTPAQGLGLIYDTLTASSLDEPGTQYALLAKSMVHPDDFASVTFTLDERARFHDGVSVKAADVVWSFKTLTSNHPFYRAYYADVDSVEAISERVVKFTFRKSGNRELPQIVGQLVVLPEHYWAGEGRDIQKTTLEPPIGSGPYIIDTFETGRYVTYRRNPDYWAKDLNVSIGKYNFDRVRYDYFGDFTVAFEAFKAGNLQFRDENNSKNWATGYDVPAAKDGRMTLEMPANGSVQGMQGFIFNARKNKFKDLKLRQAFNHAYDFEWANNTLFYGQYVRTGSYFDNSELAATGLPSPEELQLLTPLQDQLPASVFTQVYRNPENPDPNALRQNLRKAKKLLEEAGWTVTNGKLQKNGEILEVEFLLVQPAFERIVAPFIRNLEKLGVTANIRTIDPTQYQNRVMDYDFDIIVHSFGQSLSPGNEQRNYWSAENADRPGGRNLIGIKNPAIDKLVEHIIFAPNRATQITATRALDRVLLAHHFVVPHWHIPTHRLAYWHNISRPDNLPLYSHGFPNIWWANEDKPN